MRKNVDLKIVFAAQNEAPRDACIYACTMDFLEGFCLRLKLGPRDVHEGCMRGYRA